jgi:hypothetical protein
MGMDGKTRATAKRSPTDGRTPRIEVRTADEVRTLLDRRARRTLGISGEEFLRRLRSGEVGDEPNESALAVLAELVR